MSGPGALLLRPPPSPARSFCVESRRESGWAEVRGVGVSGAVSGIVKGEAPFVHRGGFGGGG